MKKLLAIWTVLAMLLSLCACTSPAQPTCEGTAEELDTIIQEIAYIPVGTMGVSMTITARAVELLDWCEATTAGSEETAIQVKLFYDTLTPDQQEMFVEQIVITINAVANLSSESLRAAMLESAGFKTSLNWSDDAFSLAACVDDEL